MVIEQMPTDLIFVQTESLGEIETQQKLIFLDIDGVMNNDKEPRIPSSHNCINERNLKALNYIFQEVPDVKVVLSSSWRYERTAKECADLVNHYFDMYGIPVVGRTPVVITPESCKPIYTLQELENGNTVCSRGYEIKYIVDRVNPTRYVIVDDWDNFLDEQRDNHVRTDLEWGLTLENAERVIQILNN